MILAALVVLAAVPADVKPPLRIAVYDFESAGFDAHQTKVVVASVLAELRKLDRVSVIGSSEIKQMLDHEAQKQLLGCSQDSCLNEIADALGVDVLVVGAITTVGQERVFSMKRMDPKQAKVTGHVERRFSEGNGEEILVAVGPAVAELFPDVPLRAGAVRGVAKEMALRLNPPPLPTWVFYSEVGAFAVSLGTAGVFGLLNTQATADLATYKLTAKPVDIATLNQKSDTVDHDAYASYACLGAAAAFAIAAGVSAFFTDFWGYAEMNEEIAR